MAEWEEKILEGDKSYFLGKDDSYSLYGIAIIMMIFLHLFAIPSRMNYGYLSLIPINVLSNIAWAGDLCVSIYAFVSGYGMQIIAENDSGCCVGSPFVRTKNLCRLTAKRIILFYIRYWLVFAVFVPLGIILGKIQIEPKELFESIFGIAAAYNETWWYVYQYLGMMLLFPILFQLFGNNSKKKTMFYIFMMITFYFFITIFSKGTYSENILILLKKAINQFGVYWLLIFLMGMGFAHFDIFTYFDLFMSKFSGKMAKMLYGVMLIMSMVLFVLYNIAIVVVPFFILSFTYFNRMEHMNLLRRIGKYSVYMWLTHAFYAYYYFQKLVLYPKDAMLIFIWETILTLATALILTKIYNVLMIPIKYCKIR